MQLEPACAVSATLLRVSFVIGAVGMLGAMLIDAQAVLGRHIGVALLGSIELSEACIIDGVGVARRRHARGRTRQRPPAHRAAS